MISIEHRFSGTTLCEFDVVTLREAAEKGKANLYGADLRGANLGEADLYGADLGEADLGGANLRGANLRGANLGEADLGEANLYGANLRGANLGEADLYGADLGEANLYGADLGGANLGGANLRGADLGEANLGDKGKLKTDGFFSVGPLGSRKDTLLAFNTDKGIFVRTGCFFDSLEAFRAAVIKTHGEESKHGKLYLGMANVIEFKFADELSPGDTAEGK